MPPPKLFLCPNSQKIRRLNRNSKTNFLNNSHLHQVEDLWILRNSRGTIRAEAILQIPASSAKGTEQVKC